MCSGSLYIFNESFVDGVELENKYQLLQNRGLFYFTDLKMASKAPRKASTTLGFFSLHFSKILEVTYN